MTVRIRVIPCLDVAAGRVVKGVNFQGLRDAGDLRRVTLLHSLARPDDWAAWLRTAGRYRPKRLDSTSKPSSRSQSRMRQ